MVTERRMNEEMEETMQENWKLRRMLLIGVAVALLTTSAVAFYEAFRLISYYESLHTCPCEDLPEIVCCRLEIFAKLFGKPSREN